MQMPDTSSPFPPPLTDILINLSNLYPQKNPHPNLFLSCSALFICFMIVLMVKLIVVLSVYVCLCVCWGGGVICDCGGN